ncbi:hypothetical protein HELRODRAFT_83734, partial [Helobdella robusta]|uniref:EamA domain-containing protein n=1 Tax=Helobdella robusta TaxID=6412 RepID=T1G599_HELRO
FWLLVTAFLWGATNPLLKKSSKGFEEINKETFLSQRLAEIKFLLSNLKYLGFLILNQCGSLVFYLTLSSADLSLAIPITNFLSLVFTGIVGYLIGEKSINGGSILGMVFVVFGVTMCIMSKA